MSANAVDEQMLEIRLPESRNDFLYELALPLLFAWPRHVYERDGRDWHRAIPLVGNGPFVLTSRHQNRVVIESARTGTGPAEMSARPTSTTSSPSYHPRTASACCGLRPGVTGMWANAIAMSTFAEAVARPDLRSARRRG